MRIKLDVPHYSQQEDVVDESWKSRSCGIVSLAMAMKYFGVDFQDIDSLIQEGLIIGAYEDGVGWKHDGLISLAHNHGLFGYREEFRSIVVDIVNKLFSPNHFEEKLFEYGVAKISHNIERNMPVIVSLDKNMFGSNDSHLVPITGTEKDGGVISGFYYHEPNPKDNNEPSHRFIDIDTFKKHWRKMAIFVQKSNT